MWLASCLKLWKIDFSGFTTPSVSREGSVRFPKKHSTSRYNRRTRGHSGNERGRKVAYILRCFESAKYVKTLSVFFK